MTTTLTRSTIKSLTHRTGSTILVFILMFILSNGNIKVSLLFTLTEAIIKTLWYIVHERGWDKIEWGRKKEKLKRKTIRPIIKINDEEYYLGVFRE